VYKEKERACLCWVKDLHVKERIYAVDISFSTEIWLDRLMNNSAAMRMKKESA
jgi:hypothetical protein